MYAVTVDLFRGGDDDAADTFGQVMSFQYRSGSLHIGQLAVGAGTDDDLIDLDILAFPCAVSIFRKVRIGNGAFHSAEIQFDSLFVFGIRICFISGPVAVDAAGNIFSGDFIHREDAVFGTGLDGHVADGETVKDGQALYTFTGKLQRLVPCSVHTDHADEGQDHILSGDEGFQLTGEMDTYGGGNFEPGVSHSQCSAQVRGTDAGGESPQRTIGAGVGVGTDHCFTRAYQTLFRQQCMFDAHFADVKIIVDIKPLGKRAAFLTAGGRLDVFVGSKMIHYHRHTALVEYGCESVCLKLIDGDREGDVVAQYQIQFRLDQLTGADFLQTCVRGKDLLCHGHSHRSQILLLFSPLLLLPFY